MSIDKKMFLTKKKKKTILMGCNFSSEINTVEIVKDPNIPKSPTAKRFACLADTHGSFNLIKPEWIFPSDFLLIAGDITNYGQQSQVEACVNWALDFPTQHRIIIAGNHDLSLDKERYESFTRKPENTDIDETRKLLDTSGITYLNHQAITIDGIHFFGSPYSMEFGQWAFPILSDQCDHFWDDVPLNTDVFLTHGPPYGILDLSQYSQQKTGCPSLLNKINQIKPKLSVFGHLHEAYGYFKTKDTLFINCSLMNMKYQMVNPIVYVDYYTANIDQ